MFTACDNTQGKSLYSLEHTFSKLRIFSRNLYDIGKSHWGKGQAYISAGRLFGYQAQSPGFSVYALNLGINWIY